MYYVCPLRLLQRRCVFMLAPTPVLKAKGIVWSSITSWISARRADKVSFAHEIGPGAVLGAGRDRIVDHYCALHPGPGGDLCRLQCGFDGPSSCSLVSHEIPPFGCFCAFSRHRPLWPTESQSMPNIIAVLKKLSRRCNIKS